MRFLFLSDYYPPCEVGGDEHLCRDVAVRLAGRGQAVAVLTSDRGVSRWTESYGHRTYLKGVKGVMGWAALAQMRREDKPVRPQMRRAAAVSEYVRSASLAQHTLPRHMEVSAVHG